MSPENAFSKRKLGLAIAVGLAAAVAVVVTGLVTRAHGNERLREWTAEHSVPTVAVVAPGTRADAGTLDLPGRLEAYSRAPLYARASGYVKSWTADIGASVKAGQLLAEIETPELDQQLAQARADLASAKSNATLAATTAKRWQAMVATGAVSKQAADEKTGDADTKQALVKSAQANVDRMAAMKGFARIVAPFDGVVTTRNTDVGALVNVGSAAGQELFVVSDTAKLRVYVSVPQNYVPSIPTGTKARIAVPEHPGRSYVATVESSSQSVNAASGTTLMQLVVDNASGELLPGGFANVSLDLPRNGTLNVPASALIFDQSGLRVATVGADDKVVLKKVAIARDLGKVVELASGLDAGDRVIESPPDGVADGDVVKIADAAKPGPAKG
ncbi:efflux RND transporter periplasmic adaptor subunit [Dokdonella sp.]|uniref:efflux RND transporter periplasmic adaptor subunit n=1 Tax=Dokdonella sp. TaxID=2291710 RepID=UPI002619D276|nr:efflux RND transporter periplasmic adaptor subunit [Dokdonella sp.]